MAQFVKVARTADLAADEAKRVEVAGRRSPSSTQRGSFYVIDDTRTNRGGPLCEGEVAGEKVT
jgi:nitrite reductase/ring-hydroxylating ferredoxin subunit